MNEFEFKTLLEAIGALEARLVAKLEDLDNHLTEVENILKNYFILQGEKK